VSGLRGEESKRLEAEKVLRGVRKAFLKKRVLGGREAPSQGGRGKGSSSAGAGGHIKSKLA